MQSLGNSVGGDHDREFTHTKLLSADMGFDAGRSPTLEVDKQELKRSNHERNMLLFLLRCRDVMLGARSDCKESLKHPVRSTGTLPATIARHCLEAFPCQCTVICSVFQTRDMRRLD